MSLSNRPPSNNNGANVKANLDTNDTNRIGDATTSILKDDSSRNADLVVHNRVAVSSAGSSIDATKISFVLSKENQISAPSGKRRHQSNKQMEELIRKKHKKTAEVSEQQTPDSIQPSAEDFNLENSDFKKEWWHNHVFKGLVSPFTQPGLQSKYEKNIIDDLEKNEYSPACIQKHVKRIQEFVGLVNGKFLDERKTALHLGQISELAPEIGQLTRLNSLLVRASLPEHEKGKLTSLPKEIGQLDKLMTLEISDHSLDEIPEEIGSLIYLLELELGGNNIAQLPKQIGQLTTLTDLGLSENRLVTLPAEIGQLTELVKFRLAVNQLTEIPKEMGQLSNLEELDLSDNQLTEIPEEMGQLSNLKELNLSDNQLTTLPEEIGQLGNLTRLDLRQNHFVEVPRHLLHLPVTTEIDLRDNQLPDEEIAAVRQIVDRRRANGMPVPYIILPIILPDREINADNALALAAQDGLNVHTGGLTESFKQRLDTLIGQFSGHFQGGIEQQREEMRAIEQRLLDIFEQQAADNPKKQSAVDTAKNMFQKAYGEQREYVNDFKYTSGRVLSNVVLYMEAQWQRTPEAYRNEAKVNGAKLLIDFIAAGKDFCDTRHIEEVLQMISIPLSQHAQDHPEVVGKLAAVAPSLDQIRDITLPVAQSTLLQLLNEDAFKDVFRARVTEAMRNDHPAISQEQLETYLQQNILEHWDLFTVLVFEKK